MDACIHSDWPGRLLRLVIWYSFENPSIPLPDVDQKPIAVYDWPSIFSLPSLLQL